MNRCRQLVKSDIALECGVDALRHQGVFEWNRTIAAAARDGHLEAAKDYFDAMSTRDVVSWNSILAAFSRCGATAEARQVSEKMPAVDSFSWSSMLSALAQAGCGEEARLLFDKIPVRDLVTWSSMLHSCGDLEEMLALFWRFPCWDVICWNEVLTAFAREGCFSFVLAFFDQMPGRSCVTWNVVLQPFSCGASPQTAASIFYKMPQWSTEAWNSMIQIQDISIGLFERMPQRDRHSWNALVSACARCSCPDSAMEALQKMPWLDVVACNIVVTALASGGRVQEAVDMFHRGVPARDVVTWNVILSAPWDDVRTAAAVFERMPQHDMVSWNSMVHARGLSGEMDKALELLHQLNCFSLVATNSIICAFGQSGQVEEARTVFDGMLHRNTVSWNLMVAAYIRAGKVAEAMVLFDAFPSNHIKRDAMSWNVLLAMYNWSREAAVLELVEKSFERMPSTSLVSWNTMLHAYACGGHSQKAEEIFQRMPDRDAVSWNGLASARLMSGRSRDAASVFCVMDMDGCRLDAASYVTALESCSMMSDLARGRMLHAGVDDDQRLRHDSRVLTAVISMYSRCAAVGEALAAFKRLSSQSVVSWTAIVAAFAQNGSGSLAQLVFQEMQLDGFIPDAISFINILSACSHAGCVEPGWRFFVSMVGDFGIQPGIDHYACIVDVLARAGNLEQARELMDSMPFVPGSDTRTSFLSACRGLDPVPNALQFVPQSGERDEGAEDSLLVGILATG